MTEATMIVGGRGRVLFMYTIAHRTVIEANLSANCKGLSVYHDLVSMFAPSGRISIKCHLFNDHKLVSINIRELVSFIWSQ
jgi:hypothetical protein